ncbi:MAG TPA: M28 family peptidase, partial [Armatimonadota bacterium]|nr:M28 family peptidase [Armatimonadota bacterium]
LMSAGDRRNTFCFSISAKKGAYLRDLMARGKKVVLRARIDSRYYTDDSFPYVIGCVRGADATAGEVLAGGHLYEWGANDNATGCAVMLEAMGALNDLIRSGALPRPHRTIRLWMGQEMYSSLAYADKNLDRLRKTVASLCLDTPAPDYNALASTVKIHMNPDVCPAFTDALYPELFRRYYASIRSNKLVLTAPFEGATDTYFAEAILGIPTTFVYMENGTQLHHNSRDTLEKVDSRSLRDLCMFTALALYYTANAGYDDLSLLAPLTYDRGTEVILGKAREMRDRAMRAKTGEELGAALAYGTRTIEYYTSLQAQALRSILKIAPPERKAEAERALAPYLRNTGEFGELQARQFANTVRAGAAASSLKPVSSPRKDDSRDLEAAALYPRATRIGPLTLEGIPPEEWQGMSGSPKWWSARNWAGASYFWCDGTRNLKEIREAVEMEAGTSSGKFDFVAWYRFLEKHGLVEFMKPAK